MLLAFNQRPGDDLAHQPIILRPVAHPRGLVPGGGVYARQVDLMAGLCGEYFQEGALRAAVTVEERMNGVELAGMFGSAFGELRGREAAQIM